jgi:hypothetical protein
MMLIITILGWFSGFCFGMYARQLYAERTRKKVNNHWFHGI